MHTLVLLSGGLDSLACIAHYREKGLSPSALFVDYGQPACQSERSAARSLARLLDFHLDEVSVSGIETPGGCIPGRNALLLILGLMHLKQLSGLVSLGIHAQTTYSDCTPRFVTQMQAIYDMYADGAVQIDAPFLLSTKNDIWALLQRHGYPVEQTYSCENGNVQCGQCLSCRDVESLHAR